MSAFIDLFATLNDAEVRYVVVGGVAVVLHGHARLTADVDLVIDLMPAEAAKAVDALTSIGLGPRLPVDARGFADSETRERWIKEKNMQVFSLIDPNDPRRTVDLFVADPIPFDELWQRSVVISVGATPIRVASIEDLISMKSSAGRPQDLSDIAALEEILRAKERPGGSSAEWPATYDANAKAQRRDIARLTPEQRLSWLEEAAGLASAAGALERKPGKDS